MMWSQTVQPLVLNTYDFDVQKSDLKLVSVNKPFCTAAACIVVSWCEKKIFSHNTVASSELIPFYHFVSIYVT